MAMTMRRMLRTTRPARWRGESWNHAFTARRCNFSALCSHLSLEVCGLMGAESDCERLDHEGSVCRREGFEVDRVRLGSSSGSSIGRASDLAAEVKLKVSVAPAMLTPCAGTLDRAGAVELYV